jgi:hypothetical protein
LQFTGDFWGSTFDRFGLSAKCSDLSESGEKERRKRHWPQERRWISEKAWCKGRWIENKEEASILDPHSTICRRGARAVFQTSMIDHVTRNIVLRGQVLVS